MHLSGQQDQFRRNRTSIENMNPARAHDMGRGAEVIQGISIAEQMSDGTVFELVRRSRKGAADYRDKLVCGHWPPSAHNS